MPKFEKEMNISGKSQKELYQAVDQHVDSFLSKLGIGSYELEKDTSAYTIDISSKFFNGTFSCQDGTLKLKGSLSLLALPFKSQLDAGIEKWVAKIFK